MFQVFLHHQFFPPTSNLQPEKALVWVDCLLFVSVHSNACLTFFKSWMEGKNWIHPKGWKMEMVDLGRWTYDYHPRQLDLLLRSCGGLPWIHAHGHLDIWSETCDMMIWFYLHDIVSCIIDTQVIFTAILVKCIHGLCYVYQQYIHLLRNFQTLVSQRAGLSFPLCPLFHGWLVWLYLVEPIFGQNNVYIKIPTNRHNLLGTNHLQHQIFNTSHHATLQQTERTQSHLAMQPAKRWQHMRRRWRNVPNFIKFRVLYMPKMSEPVSICL